MGTKNRWDKEKTNSKIADFNETISTITLNTLKINR